MIEIINSWAQKIIIVVIICTIIEMILPEGKNKKYIKTVIGIYVVFTIISPIISKLNNTSLDLNKYFNKENNLSIETSSIIDTNEYIEEVYTENLKTDIKAKIAAINYQTKEIDLQIETKNEETYGAILGVELKVQKMYEEIKTNTIKIEKIIIGEEKIEQVNISDEEKKHIKQYLAEMYCIREENIVVN